MRGFLEVGGIDPQRNGANGAHVGRDVFAGGAVTAGDGTDKGAFFVNEGHAEAVEFVFGDVFDFFAAGEFADAAIEIGEFVEREGVVEADHRGFVADLLKTFAGDAADALGG